MTTQTSLRQSNVERLACLYNNVTVRRQRLGIVVVESRARKANDHFRVRLSLGRTADELLLQLTSNYLATPTSQTRLTVPESTGLEGLRVDNEGNFPVHRTIQEATRGVRLLVGFLALSPEDQAAFHSFGQVQSPVVEDEIASRVDAPVLAIAQLNAVPLDGGPQIDPFPLARELLL